MTDKEIADIAAKEAAKTAKVAAKIIRATAKDAGIPDDGTLDEFMLARGGKYNLGPDGKPRHIRSGDLMTDHLVKLQAKRPVYFPKVADIAKDGLVTAAENPFSIEGWNVTAQGAMLKARGVEKTQAIAASVGSRIGATKPVAPPAFNAALGVKPTAADIAANPWLDDSANGEARRIAIIKLSPSRASSHAKLAGRDLAGRPLRRA